MSTIDNNTDDANSANPLDAQTLLDRAKAAGMRTDVLTQQRRWNDPSRCFSLVQEQDWDNEDLEGFEHWLSDLTHSLGIQIMRVQTEQNNVGLQILMRECVFYKEAGFKEADRQAKPVYPVPGTEELLKQWGVLDARIKVMKHHERLLAPAHFMLKTTWPYEMPMNDPLTMALYGIFVASSHLTDRRGKGAVSNG